MRQFTIAAATVGIAALISAAPAAAEAIFGGPVQQNGNMLAREKSFVFERVHLGILGIVCGTGEPIRTSRGWGSASGGHSPAILTALQD
jgi:hypothetical protein